MQASAKHNFFITTDEVPGGIFTPRTKSFSPNSINPSEPIIVYGASVYGELAYIALKSLGLEPQFFVDRSRKGDYFGIPLIGPDKLKDYRDSNIIIASADFFEEIKKVLLESGCTNVFDMSALLQLDLGVEKMSNRAKEVYKNRNIYINVVAQQCNGGISLHRVRFVVTERCSLKCRDCSHLMQYYQHPKDVDIKKYIPAFDRFLDCIDDLGDLCILGGEPFMNTAVHELISYYTSIEKIHAISIYTNGTVVPNEKNLLAMKNDKVTIHVSDYGHNHERIKDVVNYFSKYELQYFVRVYDSWQQGGELKYRGYSDDYKENIFSRCFERNCYSFFRGKFHRCPRSAHAMNLGAMPDVKSDYVDFTENNKSTNDVLQKQLRELLNKPFIEACNYCDGMDNIAQHIPPAIQIKRPLTF